MIRVLLLLFALPLGIWAQDVVNATLGSEITYGNAAFSYTWKLDRPLKSFSPYDFAKGVAVVAFDAKGNALPLSLMVGTAVLQGSQTIKVNIPVMNFSSQIRTVEIYVPTVSDSKARGVSSEKLLIRAPSGKVSTKF